MNIIVLILMYLSVGTMYAIFNYYLLINEDFYYEEQCDKSTILLILFISMLFWIIILPINIYNNLKND